MVETVKRIEVNDAYIPFIENKSRFLVLYGGGGSGKSVFASFKIMLRTTTELNHKFLVLRKVATTIKESVFAELKETASLMGISHEFIINKTEKAFYHIPTGNQILCIGLDEPEKVKSIKGISGMWLEETTEFEESDLDQLDLRVRGKKSNYVQIILSFNPVDEDHWLRKRFFTKRLENAAILHTTYKDNLFLSDEDKERLESLKERNPLFYDVYCLGVWGVVNKSGKFLYSFSSDKQVKEGLELVPSLPLWLSFDFNIDPMTVIVGQRIDKTTLSVNKAIQADNSDIYQMTDRIKADFPGYSWQVTGDASGHNRTGTTRGKTSYWKIIREELRLKDYQIHVRSKNLGLIESRVLCNSVNQVCDLWIDSECEQLINDCKYAKVDEKGVLIKDREKQKNDFLDGYRYLIDINYYDFLDNFKKYRKN